MACPNKALNGMHVFNSSGRIIIWRKIHNMSTLTRRCQDGVFNVTWHAICFQVGFHLYCSCPPPSRASLCSPGVEGILLYCKVQGHLGDDTTCTACMNSEQITL
jgi:hypothetical protein